MIIVHFTEQEIAALRQLLHRAVLHSGMDVAEAAVAITRKLIEAQNAHSQEMHAGNGTGIETHQIQK